MVETDWREILSFSQRELAQADKEKLCENLSWMEADDIELNFTDLKTLFRLAQDILKFKSEQVNNMMGQIETQRKSGTTKSKSTYMDSPTKSSDSVLDTIAHQEEVIKANKEILEQLYADIADLKGKKHKLEEDRQNLDRDSESSRDTLSEMNAVAELENEITMKNRHIRKLLGDVKVLEEENTKLKEKVSVLKDKLTEATGLIENLTEQLFCISNENSQLKEAIGKSEQAKAELTIDIENLRKDLFEKESTRENIYEEVKSKVQHWKNVAKSKKAELEALYNENTKLKEGLIHASQSLPSSPKATQRNQAEVNKIKELQEKLSEAANEIMESATIIDVLKAENKQLKATLDETPDFSVSDTKNESDDGKERCLIVKLKKKVKSLNVALQGAEEMIAEREKELAEISSQLRLVKEDEGINALIEGLKSKKRKLKLKDEGIKSLVQEVNSLNQMVDELQLENETMRRKFNIHPNERIPTKGILKNFRELEQSNSHLIKNFRKFESKLVTLELENHKSKTVVTKLKEKLTDMGCSEDSIDDICKTEDSDDDAMPKDGGGDAPSVLEKKNQHNFNENIKQDEEITKLIEENEGLRKGLQEILNFLKDNSTTTSGVLALECPSLESVLNSLDARHAAGWFAPHMAAVMELKAALGGKHALLGALHEARKETFDVMSKLSKETEKSRELAQKLHEMEVKNKTPASETSDNTTATKIIGEFGTWMSDNDQCINDFCDRSQIEDIVKKGNLTYDDQLKSGLVYFHNKFKTLFEKMTSIAVQTADNENEWSIQEEKYKAEIENLKALIAQGEEEDISDMSPGLISLPSADCLQRKCSYLEESYKYIRTLNENMRNEYLETKKEAMLAAIVYESEIQKLMITVANLTDKLRSSISLDLFWKQNEALNDLNTKYRKRIETHVEQKIKSSTLLERLDNVKADILNSFQNVTVQNETKEEAKLKSIMSNIEQSIYAKQLEQVCTELNEKTMQIKSLQKTVSDLQESQSKLIDETLASTTKEDVCLMKDQLERLAEDNKILKEQCQHVESQLDIALLQLQDYQQRQMSKDMEVNMLRHQILDLQSVGDNRAIVARLSGEVLVAHLQASESYKKIERLNASLNKEKQLRIEADEMLKARQKIFDVYAYRYEAKFRYMNEVMQTLRQQYQGSLPLVSLENYLDKFEELTRKTHDVNEKLNEIEDLQDTLMTKHSIFDQILDVSKNKCLEEEDTCQHKLQNIVLQGAHSRELDHCMKKLNILEQSRKEILKRCNYFEKTLVLVNQGFEKSLDNMMERRSSVANESESKLEVQDVQSDEEPESRGSRTVTLPKPQVLKPNKSNVDMTKLRKNDNIDMLMGSPVKIPKGPKTPEVVNVFVQTGNLDINQKHRLVQTDEDDESNNLKSYVRNLEISVNKKNTKLNESMILVSQRTEEVMAINNEKMHLETNIQKLNQRIYEKDKQNKDLHDTLMGLRKQIDDYKNTQHTVEAKTRAALNHDNKALLAALKNFESEKNSIVTDYTELLKREREQYANSVKKLQIQIMDLQTQLDRNSSDTSSTNTEALREAVSKYTVKISVLEDKCFKLQSELDGYKSEIKMYRGEVERWKDLATERLTKMEQLNNQLEERHCHEVESYKAENEHWLSQLNETQREHMELRSRLTEQKASFVKQLADKDAQIEQLRSVVHGLKSQIMNMQTMISVSDPSFDLSAIVEVEETSDAISHPGSERLELKYDSTLDLHEGRDDLRTSSTIWQEPIIERLRREKQFIVKQNSILRRQIKALAARERRSRLDAQNLKNQVFRISTSGNKVTTAETASLHNKIACLQAQLMSARRDTHSNVALWDKWKRSQQAAERWQARFEEKCLEVTKLESSIALAKSAVTRLEKEKRLLLARLSEVKSEKVLVVEKHDSERSEKPRSLTEELYSTSDPPVSVRALLDRVQAQQRRITALEVAEKGNEHLVSEYEKALAEITSLKGQVLKLESTLLESQIRTPIKSNREELQHSELDYWKSYCDMLKDENVQLNLKVNSLDTAPMTAHQHRVNDLEQTVLTLRGLVSKLQAEQKSSSSFRRPDSRPNSGRSGPDKTQGRSQLESCRIEIANLKGSIQDKDLLLERSKEMLKIAAEREDDLLRENASLRRQIDELTRPKHGFLSA